VICGIAEKIFDKKHKILLGDNPLKNVTVSKELFGYRIVALLVK
jgi:hypothetical protein